jgi:glycosyltransferase involved in cell wall biosynthesis
MSATVFYDPVCLRPYDSETLRDEAMGGTEATLVRIADALGARVTQHNRTGASGRYQPPQRDPGVGAVIVNRDSRALPAVRRLYPNARVFLWLHDRMRPGSRRARWLASTAELLRELDVRIICVSDTQRAEVEATLRWMRAGASVGAHTIYNPIDDALQPDGSPVDARKLVFLSSPNKGLKFTLDAFRALHRRMPDLELVVGNPGYKEDRWVPIEGVRYLGPQPQARVHQEVRTALCTFFPNFVIPETFGLVFAESNALGTPVLTHDCGAAREVIGDQRQILPVTAALRAYERLLGPLSPRWRAAPARVAGAMGLFDAYLERIRAWRAGERPVTGPDPRFRLTAVTARWREELALPR